MIFCILVGMIGGIANSLLMEEGFVLPHTVRRQNHTVWKAGFLSNVVLGGIAAMATYALGSAELSLLRQLGIALISGVGGGNLLVSLMQKQETSLLKTRIDTLEAVVRDTAPEVGRADS